MKLKDILSNFHGLTKIVAINGVKKTESISPIAKNFLKSNNKEIQGVLDLPVNSVKIYTEFDKSMKRNMIVVRGEI